MVVNEINLVMYLNFIFNKFLLLDESKYNFKLLKFKMYVFCYISSCFSLFDMQNVAVSENSYIKKIAIFYLERFNIIKNIKIFQILTFQ